MATPIVCSSWVRVSGGKRRPGCILRLFVVSLSVGGRRRHLAGLSGSQLWGFSFELVRAVGQDFASELVRLPRHLQFWGVSSSDAPPRGPTLDREPEKRSASCRTKLELPLTTRRGH